MHQAHLNRVIANMEGQNLSQIVVTSTSSVYYLTGIHVEPMERMLALYIRADGHCTLYANELFAIPPQPDLPMKLHTDSDDPAAINDMVMGWTIQAIREGCQVLNAYPKDLQVVG